jgi:alginate O-acetyltransferase complex protein AlgI
MSMTYTIDIYKSRLSPARKLSEYALYVSFFPKILAGPIERALNFLPQITQQREIKKEDIRTGLHQIFMGFFKKIVIADGVAQSVNYAFAGSYRLSWTGAVVGTFLFAIQIYCDFSGYSDIAIGSARLLGFKLMQNFNYPYFSLNPSQFWGRWHISLSSWFRDYVFFPLGGPYGKTLRWLRNIMVTFFVTGLWHGAGWTYIIWGLYHGSLLSIHRLKESLRKTRKKPKNPFKRAIFTFGFFILTCIGWIIFRSNTLNQSLLFIKTILTDFGNFKMNIILPAETALLGLALFLAIEFFTYNNRGQRLDQLLPSTIWTAI